MRGRIQRFKIYLQEKRLEVTSMSRVVHTLLLYSEAAVLVEVS